MQAQILELLERVKRGGTALILISHDLAVVGRIADRIAVMSNGRIVETGPAAEVLGNPRHAETRAMLAAVPAGKPRGTLLAAPAPSAAAATTAATTTPAQATHRRPRRRRRRSWPADDRAARGAGCRPLGPAARWCSRRPG